MDLKLDNLLLGEDFMLKISDFDHAVYTSALDEKSLGEGVSGFRAPETASPIKKFRNPKAIDIYALGIILFVFKFGFMPYSEEKSHSF